MNGHNMPDLRILAEGFDGADLKVKRAMRHIEELQSMLDWLGGSEVERFRTGKDAEGRDVAVFDGFEVFAREMGAVVGDASHNLRSAFDHLWSALYRAAKCTGQSKPIFPFDERRQDLKTRIGNSDVGKAYPIVETLILDKVKPYSDEGGDFFLWSITKLDNLDKHNALIPVLVSTYIRNAVISHPSGGFTTLQQNVISGTGAIGFAGGAKFENNMSQISVTPSFPVGAPLAGEPIGPTLLLMAKSTENAVELFYETFLA